MNYAKPRKTAVLLAGTALLAAAPALAGGVAAGTLIENTASATYTTGSGGSQTADSNTVTLRVDELLDVTVVSQDGGAIAVSSNAALLKFEVTNIGNGPEAFRLTADPVVTGNDFAATITSLAYDADGNGEYDPAIDHLLAAGEASPLLDADGTLTVFVLASTPAGLADAALSKIKLVAEAVTGTGAPGQVFAGEGVDGSDAVAGTTGADADADGSLIVRVASVGLVKSATVLDPFGGDEVLPGAVVTYTITATVTGSGDVADLVVRDIIPTGTTYQPGSLSLGSAALSDPADGDAGKGDAGGIAVAVGTVSPGTEHSIHFNVTVN